ncbi:MAG: hypothetical protein M3P33_01945 [bacterium]|nr:hypothetical protein [bacterium]
MIHSIILFFLSICFNSLDGVKLPIRRSTLTQEQEERASKLEVHKVLYS